MIYYKTNFSLINKIKYTFSSNNNYKIIYVIYYKVYTLTVNKLHNQVQCADGVQSFSFQGPDLDRCPPVAVPWYRCLTSIFI